MRYWWALCLSQAASNIAAAHQAPDTRHCRGRSSDGKTVHSKRAHAGKGHGRCLLSLFRCIHRGFPLRVVHQKPGRKRPPSTGASAIQSTGTSRLRGNRSAEESCKLAQRRANPHRRECRRRASNSARSVRIPASPGPPAGTRTTARRSERTPPRAAIRTPAWTLRRGH